ncbi:MAG TPA: hypothetical protein VFG03_20275, partial [Telluria sp.]|nr:hypothetical protein [Telluria sp.]
MSFVTGTSRAPATDLANRRMAAGLLLSLLLHALVLSLQFGVPGLGLPGPAPITVRLANVAPPPPVPEPIAAEPSVPLPEAAAPSKPANGMVLLDPLPPPPSPAKPAVRKGKPRQAKRISTPLPALEPSEAPTRVITQDQNPNDKFVVPLARPEESVQKTIDPKEAQAGTDEGTDSVTSAAEAEAARAAEMKAADEAARQQAAAVEARKLADEQARQAAVRQQQLDDARNKAELVARVKDEEAARQRLELAARQQEDEAARQRIEVAARQKEDELARQRAEVAARQKDEELVRQRAELAARQKDEELARRRAELEVRRKEEELARQRAELAARQQADELARRQAEERARQQAEQLAAQQQRERAAADARLTGNAVPPMAGASPGPSAGAGSAGGNATIPKGLFNSDLANRARELTKGLDVLSGTPPPTRPREDEERGRRRVVVSSSTERDIPLRMYADSFRQKIERNGGLNYSQLSHERVRVDPLVSVAIRSDGTVEDVTIVRSSGRSDT